jgi:predicted RNA methylase
MPPSKQASRELRAAWHTSCMKPLTAADAQRLREFFREARYTHEEFESRRLLLELPSRASGNLPWLLDRAREPSFANLLLRWFFLGVPAASESVAGLVPPDVLALLLECGMLIRDGGELSPTVMLTPCDQYFVAVIWPNPTTRLLHRFTIRHPSRATLDLGAGCGIQAVFTADHSAQVTATDLNPRAAGFTRFNAWLNGASNIECLTGDTFAPVRNRTFDLIVANPPFFVTPSGDQLYCENGMELDDYCRRIVREAPAHLNEGGYLQMVCEWVQIRGQSWRDRVVEWLEGTGCDCWIARSYAREAGAYAQERIRQIAPACAAPETSARWMDYYRERGVEEIHGGILAMRRRTGHNWVRIEDMPVDPNQPFGEAVSQAFVCIDFLERHCSDEELLKARLRLSPEAQLDRQSRQSDGRWHTVGMSLRFNGGIPASMRLDPAVAEFLAGLDGSRTLGELVEDLAQRVQVDSGVVQPECLAVVRKLIERRFVLP